MLKVVKHCWVLLFGLAMYALHRLPNTDTISLILDSGLVVYALGVGGVLGWEYAHQSMIDGVRRADADRQKRTAERNCRVGN